MQVWIIIWVLLSSPAYAATHGMLITGDDCILRITASFDGKKYSFKVGDSRGCVDEILVDYIEGIHGRI